MIAFDEIYPADAEGRMPLSSLGEVLLRVGPEILSGNC
jgi:hypothetical protein